MVDLSEEFLEVLERTLLLVLVVVCVLVPLVVLYEYDACIYSGKSIQTL